MMKYYLVIKASGYVVHKLSSLFAIDCNLLDSTENAR